MTIQPWRVPKSGQEYNWFFLDSSTSFASIRVHSRPFAVQICFPSTLPKLLTSGSALSLSSPNNSLDSMPRTSFVVEPLCQNLNFGMSAIPACAGFLFPSLWIPACAGMTEPKTKDRRTTSVLRLFQLRHLLTLRLKPLYSTSYSLDRVSSASLISTSCIPPSRTISALAELLPVSSFAVALIRPEAS